MPAFVIDQHTPPTLSSWSLPSSEPLVGGLSESSLDMSQAARVRSRSRPRPTIESPRDLPTPEPHFPLRKTSASRLQTRKGGVPRPLFAPSGIKPSPVQPLPYIDNVTASSEHAFAGRDARRPFKPPLGVFYDQYGSHSSLTSQGSPTFFDAESRPPSSPLLPPPPSPHSPHGTKKSLRSSKSHGDGLRSSRGQGFHGALAGETYTCNTTDPLPSPPGVRTEPTRESYRSVVTTNSSFAPTSSVRTERTSLTPNSSQSDFVKLQPDDWQDATDNDMSVEDAIGMYEDGFDGGARQSSDSRAVQPIERAQSSLEIRSLSALDRPSSQSHTLQPKKQRHMMHRRSQSASMLLGITKQFRPSTSPDPSPAPAGRIPDDTLASTKPQPHGPTTQQSAPAASASVPRDRYGFKKASHYVTVEQYDAWDATYSEHIERRSRKWHTLMRSYGLSTDPPLRFPPKSDKIKRYVRKGIPPELRGAAWFWYAGGPGKLARSKGLYWQLVDKAESGALGETDREHIERDLNRTFPDNIRFKPDSAPTSNGEPPVTGSDAPPDGSVSVRASLRKAPAPDAETPILRALRRVLQAFAVHNPNIGYCQSLNFIAGLLLLFLDEDEEKAFILLEVVTSQHLPGTHGVALEGANIDIAVLMSCIKDSLPTIWSKLDDQGGALANDPSAGSATLRLPTVSLATTAWFMSLFVGTLPIESVLRVWDCLFFEGSKTLFRIALAIFKFGSPQILAISDPMEIFQVVQTIPRSMLDINALMDVCFRRRGGFGGISQGLIEHRREERRRMVKEGVRAVVAGLGDEDENEGRLRRFTRRVRSRTAK